MTIPLHQAVRDAFCRASPPGHGWRELDWLAIPGVERLMVVHRDLLALFTAATEPGLGEKSIPPAAARALRAVLRHDRDFRDWRAMLITDPIGLLPGAGQALAPMIAELVGEWTILVAMLRRWVDRQLRMTMAHHDLTWSNRVHSAASVLTLSTVLRSVAEPGGCQPCFGHVDALARSIAAATMQLVALQPELGATHSSNGDWSRACLCGPLAELVEHAADHGYLPATEFNLRKLALTPPRDLVVLARMVADVVAPPTGYTAAEAAE